MGSGRSPAYLYWFDWAPPVPGSERYGAFHAGELGYVFGTLEMFGAVPTAADAAFSQTISELWVRFARTGDPNGEGFPRWPPYTRDNESYLTLGQPLAAGSRLRMEQVELIDRVFERRRRSGVSSPATGG